MRSRYRRVAVLAAAAGLLLATMTLVVPGCGFNFKIGCGGSEGETSTYTDAKYGYSFRYPADWQVQQGDSSAITGGSGSEGGMSVFDPDGAVAGGYYIDLFQVSVYELTTTIDDSMMPDIKDEVERLLAELESQGGDWQQTEALSDAEVSGMDGWRTTYSFTTDGTPAMSTFYFLFSGDIQYQLTLQGAVEDWEELQADFDAIVASFSPGTVE